MRTSTPRRLTAALGVGLLALGLTACGADDGGEMAATEPASPTAPAEPTASPAETGGQPDASPTASSPETSGDATGTASGSPSPDAEGEGAVEQALLSVMGPEAEFISGEQYRQLLQSSQGIAEDIEITPAECSAVSTDQMQDLDGEDVQMAGAVRTSQEQSAPTASVLGVISYPDEEQARTAMESYRTSAEECSSFAMDIGDGISAEAELQVEDQQVDADDALRVDVLTAVSVEGATLPPDADSTYTQSYYVLDGTELYSYALSGSGSAAQGVPEDAAGDEEALQLIEQLRAELGD